MSKTMLLVSHLPIERKTVAHANPVGNPVVDRLYNAFTDCANLHPTPSDPSAPNFPTVFGGASGGANMDFSSGGWITAENIHEHALTAFGDEGSDGEDAGEDEDDEEELEDDDSEEEDNEDSE